MTSTTASERWAVPGDPAASRQQRAAAAVLPVRADARARPSRRFSLTSVYTPNETAEPGGVRRGQLRRRRATSTARSRCWSRRRTGSRGRTRSRTSSRATCRSPTRCSSYRQADVSTCCTATCSPCRSGDGLLYVQPIYTQRSSTSGSGTYPQLQFVARVVRRERRHRSQPGRGAGERLGEPIGVTNEPGDTEQRPAPERAQRPERARRIHGHRPRTGAADACRAAVRAGTGGARGRGPRCVPGTGRAGAGAGQPGERPAQRRRSGERPAGRGGPVVGPAVGAARSRPPCRPRCPRCARSPQKSS